MNVFKLNYYQGNNSFIIGMCTIAVLIGKGPCPDTLNKSGLGYVKEDA